MDTPSKPVPSAYRLLYRGSVSLPDSDLLLDGLSFSVKTGETHGSPALLNNTLALTLESLRGLPLHLIGTVRLNDTWIDPVSDINVDIHPDAALTRMYLENLFCLTPITSSDGRTDYGIRISLTDDNDPTTPDLLIYGELRDVLPTSADAAVPSTSHALPKTLHLLAARILPGPPPPPSFRIPRPDDPTPRRPPLAFGAKRKRDASATGTQFDITLGAETSRRPKTADWKGKGRATPMDEEAMRKAAAETMRRIPRPQNSNTGAGQVHVKVLGKDARVGTAQRKDKDVFKVPSVPLRRTGSEADVFGTVGGDRLNEEAGVKKDNKTAVKNAVAKFLAKEKVGKTHPEYKELFQMCYQGACFAMRHQLSKGPLDSLSVDHFVDAHVKMYLHDSDVQS